MQSRKRSTSQDDATIKTGPRKSKMEWPTNPWQESKKEHPEPTFKMQIREFNRQQYQKRKQKRKQKRRKSLV